jgi:hypothetical protein
MGIRGVVLMADRQDPFLNTPVPVAGWTLSLETPKDPVEVAQVPVTHRGCHLLNHDLRISKHRLGGLKTATRQKALQGLARDPSKDPAKMGPADACTPGDGRQRGPFSRAPLDEFEDPANDREVMQRNVRDAQPAFSNS